MIDAHLHVVDPRFPLVPNQGYLPPTFTVGDYRRRVRGLGVAGGAVVSGSFQGHAQEWLRSALAELGPGFVGVTQLPPAVPDEQVRELHGAGVRAVRFTLRRGADKPSSRAAATTLSRPTSRAKRMAAVLTECANASASVRLP